MKQLTCEMCESTNLIKQDGVLVCQDCGTKYSIKEAKKMMIEGTVDVSGSTVKIDTSDELANLYLLAHRAKDNNKEDDALKYYDMILLKDPTSWEASFFVVYYKAMMCQITEISTAASSVDDCIGTVLKLIKDYVKDKNRQIKAVQEVALHCCIISSMMYNAAKNHYNDKDFRGIDKKRGIDKEVAYATRRLLAAEMVLSCTSASIIMSTLGCEIDDIFGDDKFNSTAFGDYTELNSTVLAAWKDCIDKDIELTPYVYISSDGNSERMENHRKGIMLLAASIQHYDSSYQTPTVDIPDSTSNDISDNTSSSGCYVATVVYGSYDCPQVWTLRRYRDYTLAETWYGRAFIHTYYAISPTLVKWFGDAEWFKKMCKGKLDRMVANLKAKGVEDTPYEDKTLLKVN